MSHLNEWMHSGHEFTECKGLRKCLCCSLIRVSPHYTFVLHAVAGSMMLGGSQRSKILDPPSALTTPVTKTTGRRLFNAVSQIITANQQSGQTPKLPSQHSPEPNIPTTVHTCEAGLQGRLVKTCETCETCAQAQVSSIW